MSTMTVTLTEGGNAVTSSVAAFLGVWAAGYEDGRADEAAGRRRSRRRLTLSIFRGSLLPCGAAKPRYQKHAGNLGGALR